ncbi:MAG: hypothetical protein P1U56_20975 [Saprospiraceae bacterium]|nr:hypothetical protein [Saprospiraceae bacterium]
MSRSAVLLLLILFYGCISISDSEKEILQFEKLLGGKQNRVLLDDFILLMENKIVSTYQAGSLNENYNLFLEDILKLEEERVIQYDNLDCKMVYDFESTSLDNQYIKYEYDTVYFDVGIVTVDENGDREYEVFPPNDSLAIAGRIKHYEEKGYTELIEIGRLQTALRSDALINLDVKEYYSIKDKKCYPMFEDYINTMHLQKLDFNNYVVKANLFYTIYLADIAYHSSCYD